MSEIIKHEGSNLANFDVPTGFVNTIDLSTNAGKMKVINATNNSVALKDHMQEVLKINNVITMPGIRKGRNGMPDVECINTYLVDVDGVSYFSQSDGVSRAVRMLVAMWPDMGRESTDDGYLPLKCEETQLANGNTMKTLIIAE